MGDAARLAALREYQLLDTLPEQALDDLTTLAAHICQTPVSLISLVDEHRQWFKSRQGWEGQETPRDQAFCNYTIEGSEVFVVPDTTRDPRFADNPLVTVDGIRAYAGAPLITPTGEAVGALCVMDREPRELTASQLDALRILSRQVMAQFELRKQAHQLSVSHERFQAVARATNDAVWDWNLVTDEVWWNDSFRLTFGYHPSAPADSGSWVDNVHPDDRLRVKAGIQAVISSGGELWSDEYRFLRQDGSVALIYDRGVVLYDPHGKPVRMVGAMQDLSARQLAEGRYRTLFDYAPDGILIADEHSFYLDANPSICRMLGYTREEFIGLHASDIVMPHELKHIDPALSTLRSREDHHREWQFRRKDGTLLPAEVIATALPDGQLMGLIRDITERKQAEARFRRLVDSNVQGVMLYQLDGSILEANDAFLTMVGYTREDLESGLLNWRTLTPPGYDEQDQHAINQLTERGIAAPFEKEYLRKDGSRVPILLGPAAFHDNPREGVCFVIDLSERKKMEEQFLRAQRMEGIGTLAGGMAHDLNNVLTPILMAVSILSERARDDEERDLLATLHASASRGAELVKQVLSFARGVKGERVTVNPLRVLDELLSVLRETFPKSIRVVTSVSHDLLTVTGDPTQIHQVLLNLCVNARDAMPTGGSLRVGLQNVVLETGDYVRIEVADTGSGIPKEQLNRIFEPFFTTKEVGAGTGLGLSTTLAIVKSHRGLIEVASEVGKGTKFEVYLPANSDGPTAEPAAARQSPLPRGSGQLILVVDDEDAVRTVLRRTLERYNYRVLEARHGAEAVALFARTPEIDLVLTDMAMPVMDGPALILALRSLNPEVRIVASSGLSTAPEVEYFVPKPYTAEVLLRTVQAALG